MFPSPIYSIVLHVKRKKFFRCAGRLFETARLRQTLSLVIILFLINSCQNATYNASLIDDKLTNVFVKQFVNKIVAISVLTVSK